MVGKFTPCKLENKLFFSSQRACGKKFSNILLFSSIKDVVDVLSYEDSSGRNNFPPVNL